VCLIGDRAEGAEAAVEAGLSKLTLTAAHTDDDRQDDGHRYPGNPEVVLPPAPATAGILLVNSV